MCYAVTWFEPATSNAELARSQHQIADTEEDARKLAENKLLNGFRDVALWKQVATPSVRQVVDWNS